MSVIPSGTPVKVATPNGEERGVLRLPASDLAYQIVELEHDGQTLRVEGRVTRDLPG